MRRTLAIAAAALSLAGCSSFSLDAFKPSPPTVQVQLDSTPPGADALTSVGPGCKTPCTVAVPVPEAGFSVTYTLNRFQPVTIPVQLVDPTTVNPNPVVAELQPAAPPRPVRKRVAKPRKPKAPKAAPAPAAGSPDQEEQAPAGAAPPPAAAPAPAPPPGR